MSPDIIDLIVNTIKDTLRAMDISASVEPEDSITKGWVFNIDTPDSYLLIGKQGMHLRALQVLVQSIVANKVHQFIPFSIDVDDYTRKREWFLKETAKQAVDRCKRIGKPVPLEPMPNFERKLVHAYLQDNFPGIVSDSVGYEPRRRIVVRVK